MGTAILWIGLLVNSVCDIRMKKISLAATVLLGVIGLVLQLINHELQPDSFLSLLPGIICLFLAWLSKEQIGYGDGALLMAVGCYLDWSSMLGLCMLALSMASLYALVLFLVFKKGKSYEFPFAPFLFLGFCIGRWFL